MENGLVEIYTGDGKGKTTASLGLAIRALGAGFKVIIIQFFKSEFSSELLIVEKFKPNFILKRFNTQKKFMRNMNPDEIDKLKKETLDGINYSIDIMKNHLCDVLILDEIFLAVKNNFIKFEDIKNMILNKPVSMELILTGRDAPLEIIELADLVTEMKKIKHPFDKGIIARIGIEK